MKRRPRRGVPAVLTAVVLVAACAVVATVAIQTVLGQPPLLGWRAAADALHGVRWNDLAPALAGGVAVVLGVVLVLAAVLPGKPTVLPLRDDETAIESGAPGAAIAARCARRRPRWTASAGPR